MKRLAANPAGALDAPTRVFLRRWLWPSAAGVIGLAGFAVLIGTVWFGALKPGYSHISNTISELGETGAPHARLVSFGFFLPVGLLVWWGLWVLHLEVPDTEVSVVFAAMSCLGAGYAVAAFFPCDPGGPLYGSWRTLVHNVTGFVDYEGTGIGFLLAARYFARRGLQLEGAASLVAGVLVLLCLVALSLEAAMHVRGVVQRFAEVVQFTGLFLVCAWLPRSRRFAVHTYL